MTDEGRLVAIQEILDDIPDIKCQDTELSCGWKVAIHSIQHVLDVTDL